MARLFYLRTGRLPAIFDLACALYPDLVAAILRSPPGGKLGLLVRFLQHHFRRLALEGRARDG